MSDSRDGGKSPSTVAAAESERCHDDEAPSPSAQPKVEGDAKSNAAAALPDDAGADTNTPEVLISDLPSELQALWIEFHATSEAAVLAVATAAPQLLCGVAEARVLWEDHGFDDDVGADWGSGSLGVGPRLLQCTASWSPIRSAASQTVAALMLARQAVDPQFIFRVAKQANPANLLALLPTRIRRLSCEVALNEAQLEELCAKLEAAEHLELSGTAKDAAMSAGVIGPLLRATQPSLTALHLRGFSLNRNDFAALGQLPRLTALTLEQCGNRMADGATMAAGVAALASSSFPATSSSAAAGAAVPSPSSLTHLDFRDAAVFDDDIADLAATHPQLQHLTIRNNTNLTNDALQALSSCFPALRQLDLEFEEASFTLPAFVKLGRYLRTLSIAGRRIFDKHVVEACEVLGDGGRVVSLRVVNGRRQLTVDALARLDRIPDLQTLILDGFVFSDPAPPAALAAAAHAGLQRLELHSVDLGTLGFENIAALSTLSHLTVQTQQQTLAATEQLAALRGLVELRIEHTNALNEAAIRAIATLPKLRTLALVGGLPQLKHGAAAESADTDAVALLLPLAKQLRSLSIHSCHQLHSLRHLAQLTELRVVSVHRCPGLDRDCWSALRPLAHLRQLVLGPLRAFSLTSLVDARSGGLTALCALQLLDDTPACGGKKQKKRRAAEAARSADDGRPRWRVTNNYGEFFDFVGISQ